MGRADGFDNLELDNGIHPFRKDLRWILFEMRNLGGLFSFRPSPEECYVEGFKDLPNSKIAKKSRSKLPDGSGEPNSCQIQQCVFLGLVQLEKRVVKIKGEIEDKDVASEKERYEVKNVPEE